MLALAACGGDDGKSAAGGSGGEAPGGSGGDAPGGSGGDGGTGGAGGTGGEGGTGGVEPVEPEVLLEGLVQVHDVAVDAGSVWVLTEKNLRRLPRDGGDPETISVGTAAPQSFHLGSDTVWYVTRADAGAAELRAQPKAGGDPTTLATMGDPVQLTGDASGLIWIDDAGDRIDRLPFAGGAAETLFAGNAKAMAVDGADLFLMRTGVSNEIRRVSLDPAHPGDEELVSGIPAGPDGDDAARALALDDGFVYWADTFAGTIFSVARGGGTKMIVADGEDHPVAVAIDDAWIWWANAPAGVGNERNGAIRRMPRTGGAVETVASGLLHPSTIAVADDAVYWITRGSASRNHVDGTLMRLRR